MLTDTKIKQAKAVDKMYKLYDELGLYMEILPTGRSAGAGSIVLPEKKKCCALARILSLH